jgi:hypothetical protein
MITGCNTNVLYRGKQFHVQTEDSGRANPHIISHVYHGGTIIASEKSEYGDRIDSSELDIKVRAQIELQHKTMLKRLTGGDFDEVIDERLGGGVAPAKPKAPPVVGDTAAGSTASSGDVTGSVTPSAAGAVTASTDPALDADPSPADTKPIIDDPAAAAFGSGSDAEKPLDEVILEYLVDKARDRKNDKKQTPPRQQRQKG